jgi:hypothetical protein
VSALGSWLRRFIQWLKKPTQLWIALGVILAAGIVVLFVGINERTIRLTGLFLQLLGIATVIWGIELTRRLFGHPTLLGLAAGWLRQFPPYRRKVGFGAAAGSVALTGAKARMYVTSSPPQDATLEQRVASLEANIRHLNKRIDDGLNELDELQRLQTDALRKETQERTAEDAKIAGRLESSSTGGLHISAIGALWLFVGVILSTAAPEIAHWLK